MISLDDKMRAATVAREMMDYPRATRLYTEVLQDDSTGDELARQAFHMLGVCHRCLGEYELALANLESAEMHTTEQELLAHIARDKAMVYIDRWELPLDRSRALELLDLSFTSFERIISALYEDGSMAKFDAMTAEGAATRGFFGRVHLKHGDLDAAVINLRLARRDLKKTQKHYLVNNQVWLVRALSQHKNPFRRYLESRLHAIIGLYESIFAKQDGRRAGSNTRAKEFIVLLLGGEKLYVLAKEHFLKKSR